MNKNEYVSERLKTNKDDREDTKKLNLDAELRGSIGIKEGNKIIHIVDKYKSER